MEKSCSKEYTTWGDITGFDSAEVVDLENGEVNDMQIVRVIDDLTIPEPESLSIKNTILMLLGFIPFLIFLVIIC